MHGKNDMSYELCKKIKDLTPYEPSEGEYRVRLDANESYIDLPENIRREIGKRISSVGFNRYPDPTAKRICELFAKYYDISPELVTAGNGSDELLSILTQSFLMRGDCMAVFDKEFSMYAFYAEIAEAKVAVCEKNPDGSIDAEKFIEHINSTNSRLAIFSNPCNPTGIGIDAKTVLHIVDSCPDCLIVVDEAYMDFWDQSVIAQTASRDNMMVLRTCSKAFRMAGIRCGFAVANATVTKALRAVKSPYNVSVLTQETAAVVLEHDADVRNAVKAVVAQRDKLGKELYALANEYPDLLNIYPSTTNFFYIKMPAEQASKLYNELKGDSIIIRCFGDALRITVGSDEENAALLQSIKKHIQQL